MSMTALKSVLNFVNSEKFFYALKHLYMLDMDKDNKRLKHQQDRYKKAINRFVRIFGKKEDIFIVSSPGRTEIGGNHTDHNNGLVFSAAVNLDIIAVASKRLDNIVNLYSEEFKKHFKVSTNDLEKKKDEAGSSSALIRGILRGLKDHGYEIGGFDAYLTSDIPEGSGLSSSAAFEVVITEILNNLYNNGKVDKTEIAKISRYAENVFFEKPCGLMDQLTSTFGGLLKIDFRAIENPKIKRVNYDFSQVGYRLCIINTGSSHSNLTDEYSSIIEEMKTIARHFELSNCREIQYERFIRNIPKLRKLYGDRAILRVLHFLNENKRVDLQVEALEGGDFQMFLKSFKESGNSSFKWLQNVYSCKDVKHQGITLALAIAENIYHEDAVARVHGGGFAGTVQIFVKDSMFENLSEIYRSIFGNNSVFPIIIRNEGSILLNNLFKESWI